MLNQVYMQTVWEERNRGPSELTAGRGLIGLGVGATSNVRSSGRIGFIFFTVRLLGTMREEVTESKHAIEIFRKKNVSATYWKKKKIQCDQIHGPETLTAFHDTTQTMMAIYPFGTARPHPRPPVRLPTPHPATTSTSTSSFLWVPLPQSAISSPLLLLIPVSCFSFHLHLVSSMFPIPSSKYMHGSIKQYKCS